MIFRLLRMAMAFLGLAVFIALTPLSAQTTKRSQPAARTATTAVEKGSHARLDINSASKEELEQLPGIGPVMAQKIIDGRPYRAKSDLVQRKILPKSTYEQIREQVVAHRKK